MTNPMIPEDAIRMRSYLLWEHEGRPEGRHVEHWLQAAEELKAEAMISAGKASRVSGASKSGAGRRTAAKRS